MVLIIQEPEGAWRCNECGDWAGDPYEHAKIVHETTDHSDILLINTEDI